MASMQHLLRKSIRCSEESRRQVRLFVRRQHVEDKLRAKNKNHEGWRRVPNSTQQCRQASIRAELALIRFSLRCPHLQSQGIIITARVQVVQLTTAAPGKQIQFLETRPTKKPVLLILPEAAFINTIKTLPIWCKKKGHYCFLTNSIFNEVYAS